MSTTFATSQGSPGRANEDYALITNDLVILLDGAGGPSELASGCAHGVVWFVRQLAARLLGALSSRETPLEHALSEALQRVAESHETTCELTHPGTPSATICVLRRGVDSLDYLVLSDSTILIERTDGEVAAVTDRRIDEVAPAEREAMLRYPFSALEHQEHRVAKVRAEQLHRNTTGGFWVAAAQPEAASHALTGILPLQSVRRAALLTDGAARALDWGLLEPRELLDQAEDQGPEQVIQIVRAAEQSDPDGTRWPRSKPVDDATLVLWTGAAARQ